jgi:hypothetical protein
MEFFWFWDVVDMSGISDRVVPKVWIVNIILVFFIYFIVTPKSVVCEFVPVDASLIFIEFDWVCPVAFGIIIPYVN